MAGGFNVRCYKAGDEEAVVSLWNICLFRDPITLKVFERKVLLDPNFDPEGCFIAEKDGEVLGFVLALARKFPLYHQGMEEDKGWITSLFVSPQYRRRGVGSLLVNKALGFLSSKGRVEAWFSPYTPNFFFPGVDLDAYPEGFSLLGKHGFIKVYDALAMDLFLGPDFKVPDDVLRLEGLLKDGGIIIQTLETRHIYPFLKFLKENFSGDWYRHSLEMLQRGCDKDQILIALKDGTEVVGYSQYFNGEEYGWEGPGEHFGPFGVREDMRGRGIGTVLLFKCLRKMRERGIRHAFLLWTDERTAKIYLKAGFKVTRRFAVMKKSLR